MEKGRACVLQGGPSKFSTLYIIAKWNNSDASGEQIFGLWNERVARKLGLRGLDTSLRAGKVLCLPPKRSLDGASPVVEGIEIRKG